MKHFHKFHNLNVLFFSIALTFLIGLSAGYVLGSWGASGWTRPDFFSFQRVEISGGGTELIDTPRSLDGKMFNLISHFEFSNTEFHCKIITNDDSFTVATYGMGNVEIPKGAFHMKMDSTQIDSIRRLPNGSVEMRGSLNSLTRVGTLEEAAVVPFRAILRDGGPGYENDSLTVAVFYNNQDSPMQFAIFGPATRFGAGRQILSGDISVVQK